VDLRSWQWQLVAEVPALVLVEEEVEGLEEVLTEVL